MTSRETAPTSHPSGLVKAIKAALVVQGVPIGSKVDVANGPPGGLGFTVDETDTISSDGKTYKGMFDFKLWPPSYDAVGVGTPIAEVKGTTAATRIIVD